MMMMMNKRENNRKAVALLVVLFIVMAITLLSLGFLSKNDVELACGENMIIRTEMDYLAESGLQQAKGFILNPQDTSGDYWAGASAQQLVTGSDDYYDVSVQQLGSYNYKIWSTAYKEKEGEQIARGRLSAELRLDPCFAYYQEDQRNLPSEVTIYGEAYFCNDVSIYGKVGGDVYSKGTIYEYGTIQGRQYESNTVYETYIPGIYSWLFSMYYYIDSTLYSVGQISSGLHEDLQRSPSASNPAGIFYCNGDLSLRGDCSINGMLVVYGDLRLYNGCNLTITAVKNFPALLVVDDLTFESAYCHLEITGLAKVVDQIDLKNMYNGVLNVTGALYVFGAGIRNTYNCSVTITASQEKGSIQTWPTFGTPNRYSPAAGAFFKRIEREEL